MRASRSEESALDDSLQGRNCARIGRAVHLKVGESAQHFKIFGISPQTLFQGGHGRVRISRILVGRSNQEVDPVKLGFQFSDRLELLGRLLHFFLMSVDQPEIVMRFGKLRSDL